MIRVLQNCQYVFSLRTFRSVCDFKLYFLPLNQSFITVAGDRAVMHENILLAVFLYKTVTLCIIEPFDCT